MPELANGRSERTGRAGQAPAWTPCPHVRFPQGFARRLEQLVRRLTAGRAARESAGAARWEGFGDEFVGHRPYRPGEDLRSIDWNLFARFDQPYARVTRREAGEEWSICIDASASMGVGPPGKLQHAAELAAGLCAVGLRRGVRLRLFASDGAAPIGAARAADLPRSLRWLEERTARGERGLAALLQAPPPARHGRVFLLGDLLDLEPSALGRLARPGRELFAAQILAPLELLAPTQEHALGAAVQWIDAERGERLRVDLGSATADAYRARLETWLDAWRASALRHRARFVRRSSADAMEDGVRALLGA